MKLYLTAASSTRGRAIYSTALVCVARDNRDAKKIFLGMLSDKWPVEDGWRDYTISEPTQISRDYIEHWYDIVES